MGPQTKALMDAIQKRLSVLVYVSIAGLVATGLLLGNRSPDFQGLFHFGNSYSAVMSIKHILVLVMIVVALDRSITVGRRSGPSSLAQEKLKVGLLFLNIILGIAVLLLSAIVVALGSNPVM